jgi:WD40 repeat protein
MRENEFGTELRTGAYAISTSTTPTAAAAIRRRGDQRRKRNAILSGALAFIIGAGGGGVAYASLTHPGSGSGTAAAGGGTPTPSGGGSGAAPGSTRPGIVAVTTGGAVEVLDSATGTGTAITPNQDAIGDEVSVSPDGKTVYFAVRNGCADDIESVPIGGGQPAKVAVGLLPAISPDGTELAFVRESYSGGPSEISYTCGAVDPTKKAMVVVRNLATGSEQDYPESPAAPAWPVSHVSWSPDGKSLLVSAGPATGTQSWGLLAVNLASAQFYVPSAAMAPGLSFVQSASNDSYYREGVYLPGGDLFVNQLCCTSPTGSTGKVTSTLLQEISPSGAVVSQVAIGDLGRDHTSLAATQGWLLYLSGQQLLVSDDGARPSVLGTGSFIAATWVP